MTEENKDEIRVEADTPEPEIKLENDASISNKDDTDNEVSPDEGIRELKARLEHEQTARADAEKRAREMQQQAHKAQNDVQDSNLQLIHSAMDSVTRNGHMLKQYYAQALQAGAFDKAAELQEQMSINSAKFLQLENGRAALQARSSQLWQAAGRAVRHAPRRGCGLRYRAGQGRLPRGSRHPSRAPIRREFCAGLRRFARGWCR